MKFIIGKKIGMSQIFDKQKNVIPVTIIEAGPCIVVQIKNEKQDGYNAVQIGYGFKKKINKPEKGHLKKVEKVLKNQNLNFRYLKEIRVNQDFLSKIKIGDEIVTKLFQEGERVNVQGVTKGKGFQGVVKRWGFKGKPATHGTKHEERQGGSIGIMGMDRVMRGKKMPGRMGAKTKTIKNLEIVKIDFENNLMAVRGAVPGQINRLLKIESS